MEYKVGLSKHREKITYKSEKCQEEAHFTNEELSSSFPPIPNLITSLLAKILNKELIELKDFNN